MKEQKPFLNPNLDLVTLSRLVGTNRTQLSTTLNRQTGMNFSRWLAEYRVHHLLSLVALRPDSDITALASESGFTSEPPSSGSSGKSPDLRPTNTETYEKRPANNLLKYVSSL